MRSRIEKGHYGRPYLRMRSELLAGNPTCYLCGEPIDTTLHWKNDWAPQIHLIVPITMGGSWRDKRNCVPAHRLCNIRQSNHPDGAVWHGVDQQEYRWIESEEP